LSFNAISLAAPQRSTLQQRATECKLLFTMELQLSLISDGGLVRGFYLTITSQKSGRILFTLYFNICNILINIILYREFFI